METMEWNNDPLLRGALLDNLKSGKVETREFLRPVFKWMKQGGRYYDPEKAFAFVDWMIKIRDGNAVDILQQSHVQPKYAYNTIITMAQRYDRDDLAFRAYSNMISNSMEPDVFTLTALIDVMGRNGRFSEAMKLYEDMMSGKLAYPNVVTFVSLIRVVGNLRGVATAANIVERLVEDAQALSTSSATTQVGGAGGGAVVVSIYNAALSAFVRLKRMDRLVSMLIRMRANGVDWTSLSFDIVSKFFWRHGELLGLLNVESYVESIKIAGGLSEEAAPGLVEYIKEYLQLKDKKSSEKKIYAGCLGPDAPLSMRVSVMQHDLGKLLDRLEPEDNSQLTENDFVTLLHQCRKRKWVDQISYILSQMNFVATDGVPHNGVAPQPHLAPTRITYEAAMDGYFNMQHKEEAWLLLLEALEQDVEGDAEFLHFVVGGFIHCGDDCKATDAYFLVRDRLHVLPTVDTVRCLLRGLGGNIAAAIRVLTDAYDLLDRGLVVDIASEPMTDASEAPSESLPISSEFLLTLVQSCAALGRTECILEACESCLGSQVPLLRSAAEFLFRPHQVAFVEVCLMAACSRQNLPFAMDFIAECQMRNYIPATLNMYALALETLGCFVDQSLSQAAVSDSMSTLPFRGFLRVGAVKLMESKRNILALCVAHAHESDLHVSTLLSAGTRPTDGHVIKEANEAIVKELCQHAAKHFSSELRELSEDVVLAHYAQCYMRTGKEIFALSYMQLLYALSVMVRCKEHKALLLEKVRNSLAAQLQYQSYATTFLCGAITVLPSLEVSNKQQSKLIALVVSSICDAYQAQCSGAELWAAVYGHMKQTGPCLEVVKEVCRGTRSLSEPQFSTHLLDLLVSYMEERRESPIKIVQVINQFSLYSEIDTEKVDELLVSYCLEDSAAHWMALTTYISDHGDGKYDACIRVCRILSDLDEIELTAKMLCRFQVLHEEEFLHIMQPSASLFTCGEGAAGAVHTSHVLHIDQFDVNVVIVDGLDVLETACQVLTPLIEATAAADGGQHTERVISLDAEWRPFSRNGGKKTKCSLLQVACPQWVFLFDLMVLESAWTEDRDCEGEVDSLSELQAKYSQLMDKLMSTRYVRKLGYKVDGDFKRLRESFPGASHYRGVQGALELSGSFPHTGGLSGLCRHVLHKQLDKTMQTSDWQARPLSEQQRNYAALDAYVLLLIYDIHTAKRFQQDPIALQS